MVATVQAVVCRAMLMSLTKYGLLLGMVHLYTTVGRINISSLHIGPSVSRATDTCMRGVRGGG